MLHWTAPCAAAQAAVADPLNSPMWDVVQKEHFKNQKIEFDTRVKVNSPTVAEDPLNVPVAVDVSEIADVQEVRVYADLNPIVKVLQFYPDKAKPYLAFRVKLQQSSPIRAAARTRDGVWHMSGVWVTTTGGGCTVPSAHAGSGLPLWQSRLGAVQGRVWAAGADGQRVRARIIHPMDTGLAPESPPFTSTPKLSGAPAPILGWASLRRYSPCSQINSEAIPFELVVVERSAIAR